MAKGSRNGSMGLIMRVIGGMGYCKEKEFLIILMGISIQVLSSRIEPMDLELTFTKMVKFTKATGRMICIMVKAKRISRMAQHMKVSSMRASDKGTVFTNQLRTILCTKAIGTTI